MLESAGVCRLFCDVYTPNMRRVFGGCKQQCTARECWRCQCLGRKYLNSKYSRLMRYTCSSWPLPLELCQPWTPRTLFLRSSYTTTLHFIAACTFFFSTRHTINSSAPYLLMHTNFYICLTRLKIPSASIVTSRRIKFQSDRPIFTYVLCVKRLLT